MPRLVSYNLVMRETSLVNMAASVIVVVLAIFCSAFAKEYKDSDEVRMVSG